MALDSLLVALNALAQDIDIRVLPTASPYVFDLQLLTPPSSRKDPLSVEVSTEVTDVVGHPVDLFWVSRDVRFVDTQLPMPPAPIDLTNLGALPVVPSLPTDPVPQGVPGSIGRISGAFPVAVPSLQTITHPVSIELRWSILDENQEPLTSGESFGWKIGTDLAGEGGVIQPPPDRVTELLKLTLIPPFVDLTGIDLFVGRWIQARFRLKAGGTSTAWFDLRVKVNLPALPIPTLAFLFQHKQMQPPVLLMMPANSPLGPDDFIDILERTRDTLDQLRGVLSFLGLFVSEVNDLNTILQGASIKVAKADDLKNLNDLDLIHHPNWPNVTNIFVNDTEAEDELSSLLYFGPPGRRLKAYNARNFSNKEGEMHVVVGRELVVRVWDLHSASPGSVPGNRVSVPKAPTGCRGTWCFLGGGHDITTFGDEFSSLKLTW